MFNLESSPCRRIFQPQWEGPKSRLSNWTFMWTEFWQYCSPLENLVIAIMGKTASGNKLKPKPKKGYVSLSLSLNLVNSPTHSVGQSPKWLQMMMIYPYVELKFYVCCESVNVADQLGIVNENFFSCVWYGSTLWLKPITLLLAVKSCLQGS